MNRPSRLAVAAALLLALGLSSGPARAWTPIDGSRPVWTPPAPYMLTTAGSADLPIATLEPIVQRAFEDWTRVSCGTSLSVAYGGRTSTRADVSTYDGISVVSWVESGWRHGSGAIGVTAPKWSSTINEADMELNGENYTWIEGSGTGSRVNAYSIVVHEAGHYMGLGHSTDGSAAMYYAYGGGVLALNADDGTGICALYPGGSTPTDCATTGCPSGQTCTGGVCVTPTGDGSVCSPCSSGADCTGAGSYCLTYPSGGNFCGQACTSAAGCNAAAGDVCADLGGVGQCVRLVGGSPDCSGSTPPSGCTRDSDCAATERCNTTSGACEARPAGGALGAPCSGAAACASGLCVGGTCSQTCDWLSPSSCPSGFYCDGDLTGTCNDGVCRAGSAGTGAAGSACTVDTQCAALFCSGGVCAQPCVPGGAAACPAGFACQAGTLPTCGACKTSGALGDPCTANDDCTSGICATLGDRQTPVLLTPPSNRDADVAIAWTSTRSPVLDMQTDFSSDSDTWLAERWRAAERLRPTAIREQPLLWASYLHLLMRAEHLRTAGAAFRDEQVDVDTTVQRLETALNLPLISNARLLPGIRLAYKRSNSVREREDDDVRAWLASVERHIALNEPRKKAATPPATTAFYAKRR